MNQRRFLFYAAICGFLGVGLGAFGAHGLKNVLSEHGLDIYKTAVSYQMWHTLALALVGIMPEHRYLRWAGWSLLIGIVLFSGSLYLLAIFNLSWLGMITPFGGVAFLLAWAAIAKAALQYSGGSDG